MGELCFRLGEDFSTSTIALAKDGGVLRFYHGYVAALALATMS